MKFDNSFPKRVAAARQSIGLTQAQLAKVVGVVQRQIAAYEGAEAKPREKILINLAAALGTTVSWLTTGQGEGPNTSHIKRTVTVREVPLLSHIQVMGVGFDFDEFIKSSSASDFIPAPPSAGEYSFAVEVIGESMTSNTGVSFPEGTIVIIDPEDMPENGDFGLFSHLRDNEITFRQYIIDQGKEYLRPLNPHFPIVTMGHDIAPIGKIIYSQQSFERKKTIHNIDISEPDVNYSNNSLLEYAPLEKRLERIEEKLDMLINNLCAITKKPE